MEGEEKRQGDLNGESTKTWKKKYKEVMCRDFSAGVVVFSVLVAEI